MEIVKFSIPVVFIAVSIWTDYREWKIKNILVLTFLIIGVLLNTATAQFTGCLDSLAGFGIPLVLFPLFMLRMLGAGDVKALCAIGSIIGFKLSIYTMALSLVCGGALALVFMLCRKNVWQRLKQFWDYLIHSFWAGKPLSYEQFNDKDSKFRFSLGIALGYIGTVIWHLLGGI